MTKISSVTVLSSFPPIKGISKYTLAFLQELEKHTKVEVLSFKSIYPEFLYPGGTKEKAFKRPELHNTKVHQFITWYNPFSWIRAGFMVSGDIFHVQWWSWALAPMYLVILGIAKLRKKKVVMTVHNVLPHESSFFKNLMTRLVYKLADKVIVHTSQNQQDLGKILVRVPIKVLPHGALKTAGTSLSRHEVREQIGIRMDQKVLLFFGNIREYKGLDVLLLAMENLSDRYELIVAGQCWEDWRKYQAIIDHHGLGDRVLRIKDFIPEDKVSVIFKASDLLVLPYNEFEAGSGVGALGLSMEIPTLASDVKGLEDIVISSDFIFEAGNPANLADRVQWFFTQEKSFNHQIELLRKKFDWEAIIQKTLEFYEK